MDVPMPAGSGNGVRAGGVPWRTWVEEHRRPVIIGAFVAAALLGILIGLVTAPNPNSSSGTDAAAATAAALTPAQSPITWADNRVSGTGQNVALSEAMKPIVRRALAWAAADDALARAGKPTWSEVYLDAGSPAAGTAALQSAASRAILTDQAISIPQGLLYGAVEGSDASTDQFWAVGSANSTVTSVPMAPVHVWERVGSGPWKVVASGSGACAKIPPALAKIWGPNPTACNPS